GDARIPLGRELREGLAQEIDKQRRLDQSALGREELTVWRQHDVKRVCDLGRDSEQPILVFHCQYFALRGTDRVDRYEIDVKLDRHKLLQERNHLGKWKNPLLHRPAVWAVDAREVDQDWPLLLDRELTGLVEAHSPKHSVRPLLLALGGSRV